MTIEQLLSLSGKEWKDLTDEDLKKYAEAYLKITRPELAERPERITRKQVGQQAVNNKKQMAHEILASLGIKVKRW